MNRLLLDTSVFLWALSGSSRLGRKAHRAIEDPNSEVWVSALTAWELAIKSALGRPLYKHAPETWFMPELDRNEFRALPISVAHALGVASLPRHHGDPFDRLLIAQGQIEGLTIVTADAQFELYEVALLDATV